MTEPQAPTPDYDCAAALAELDAFVRGELPLEAADRMQRHLARCQHCEQIDRYERAFRARLQRVGPGACCPEPLRARIAALLAEGGGDGDPSA